MNALLLAALLADAIPLDPSQVWTAPPALSMGRAGLPLPEQRDGGTWLPSPSDEWVRDRLAAYEQYPAQCQARLDAAHAIAEARLSEALTTQAVDHVQQLAELDHEAAERWPTWIVVGAGALGVLAGGAAVYLGGQVVR